MVFTNIESIIKKYNVIIKKLLVLKPLRLTDGISTLLITDYFTTQISIGPYIKAILFFIIKLLPATPIILNMP